ncbi:GPI mannosyltransferase 2 [Chionoecetes opilio]|uniref:GPI mannosyltransferase 2 n=1 Tax=Chionoecetes opilio TaxID=41210 RepID=A0A8J4YFJ9_CHIOP|nr:GPI mannosyltransferase 2 [Chionoecetes opilio]
MKTYTLQEKVKGVAVASRLALLLLQMVSNLVFPDHQADAFVSPQDPELPVSPADHIVQWVLGGLVRWDAHYFMHIAQYGYTHENTLAFFPLFPLLVRCVAAVIGLPLLYILNYYSVLLISATLINFILFVKTADVFHKLSDYVLRDESLAYHAALLFCINPASVFFSAPYSEGLFAFLTFSALLFNETHASSSYGATMFGLASAVRSNGLVNVGFVLYRKLQDCSNYFYRIRNATTESGQLSLVLVMLLTLNYTLIPLLLGCCAVVVPFVVFQMWCYVTYCKEEGSAPTLPAHLEMFVRSNFLHSPDLGEAEWCYSFPPLAYSHVQDKYWDVGFLRYYEFRQVPNFILAMPMVMLVICHAALYMVDNPQICWGLGIPVSLAEHGTEREKQALPWPERGINAWRVFIYTAHSLCLCAFCVLCIHVQVTTRLLCSSCPVVYWFAAHLVTDPSKPQGGREKAIRPPAETQANLTKRYKVALFSECPKSFWGQVVLSYFVMYFIIGVVFYSNFLPWT